MSSRTRSRPGARARLAHASTNRWQHGNGFSSGGTPTPECPDEYAVSPSCDPFDPRDIWALQSSFGIDQSRMVGWWVELEEDEGQEALPVRSNVDGVKATTYVRKGTSALIVLANFGSTPSSVQLSFDWAVLGLNASAVTLRAPGLRVPVQPAQNSLSIDDPIQVPALTRGAIDSREGVILLLEQKKVDDA